MSKKFIIVGGGIGGLATALALYRAGVEVELFERATAIREVGSGLSLWPNATRVLQSLGVLEEATSRAEIVTRFNLQRPDGTRIATIAMGGFDTPTLSVHRAELHTTLLTALPKGCLKTDHTMQAFVQDTAGVTAIFSNGREVRADGLIGADGIRSVVRGQLHGTVAPLFRGYCIWRGIAHDPGGIPRGPISETWGHGQRFGIMPMGQGRICWYATRIALAAEPDASGGRKREVQQLFQPWHNPIRALIAATAESDILKNDAQDRPPLHHWGDGCVTLVGDAAHPITPNVGQGVCLAIEDAACLAKEVAEATNVATAFRAYEARRQTRTAFIARQARRIGAIGQWKNPWLVRGRNFMARLVLARAPTAQLNAVYGYKV